MKNVKLGLFTVASLIGIAGAFANNAKTPGSKFNDTYYALTDGAGSYTWQTAQPDQNNFDCIAKSTGFCTIIVTPGTTMTNGSLPATSHIVSPASPGSATKTLYHP